MRTGKTISITLPIDLLAKAQQIAQAEHRTMSELLGEAPLKRSRARGKALGIENEEDVERLSDEFVIRIA